MGKGPWKAYISKCVCIQLQSAKVWKSRKMRQKPKHAMANAKNDEKTTTCATTDATADVISQITWPNRCE